tara:strand:- start:173 stop:541 length:369 start_codon:yes stop_codon:yes gene_type:complete
MKKRKNNNHKVVNNSHSTNTYIQDKPILPNYVSGIEAYVRKGQVLQAVKIMRDTNDMSLMQCKDIIEEYRETGKWDHFVFAKTPKHLAKKIVNTLQGKNLLSKDYTIQGLIYLIDKVIKENE